MGNKKDILALLIAILCVAFVTLAQITGIKWMIITSLAFFLALMSLTKERYVIPFLLFFLPWSPILKTSPYSISFASVALILLFAVNCVRKRQVGFSYKTIIAVCGIIVVTLIAQLVNGYSVSASYVMFVIMLIAYPVLYVWLKDSTGFESCIMFFSAGIILATVVSFVFSDNSNLLEYIKLFEDNTIVVRHCGFYGDPNFYAAQVITAIGGQLLIINRKNGRILFNIIALIGLVICGFTSISKSYILCLAIVIAVWLYCQAKKGMFKFVGWFLVGVIGIIVVFQSGLFEDAVNQYVVRFEEAEDLAGLTTGRSTIWKDYFSFFSNNSLDLIIGQGYTSVFKEVYQGSHNTLIQCIYQFGLAGCVFLAMWCLSWTRFSKFNSIQMSNIVLILVAFFSMWMGLDLLFFDDFFLNFLLLFVGVDYLNKTGGANCAI